MRPEQEIVADWIKRVRAKKGWSWDRWAKESKVGAATTISRAVKDDYESVTSIETLNKLARGANVPSVLDFLRGDAFSVTALKPVLAELLQIGPKGRWTDRDVENLVEALAYGLSLPPADPSTPASDDAYEVAARAAAARYRDLGAEA